MQSYRLTTDQRKNKRDYFRSLRARKLFEVMVNQETDLPIKLKNPVMLLVDDDKQSRAAIRLLELSGLPFRTSQASGYNVPALDFGRDGHFIPFLFGIEHIIQSINPEAYERWLKEGHESDRLYS